MATGRRGRRHRRNVDAADERHGENGRFGPAACPRSRAGRRGGRSPGTHRWLQGRIRGGRHRDDGRGATVGAAASHVVNKMLYKFTHFAGRAAAGQCAARPRRGDRPRLIMPVIPARAVDAVSRANRMNQSAQADRPPLSRLCHRVRYGWAVVRSACRALAAAGRGPHITSRRGDGGFRPPSRGHPAVTTPAWPTPRAARASTWTPSSRSSARPPTTPPSRLERYVPAYIRSRCLPARRGVALRGHRGSPRTRLGRLQGAVPAGVGGGAWRGRARVAGGEGKRAPAGRARRRCLTAPRHRHPE